MEANVKMDHIVTDKNVTITTNRILRGNEAFPVYVEKSTIV